MRSNLERLIELPGNKIVELKLKKNRLTIFGHVLALKKLFPKNAPAHVPYYPSFGFNQIINFSEFRLAKTAPLYTRQDYLEDEIEYFRIITV